MAQFIEISDNNIISSPTEKENFNGFFIRNSEEKGRSLVASSSFRAGEPIIIEEPYGMVINNAYREVTCSVCGQICVDGRVLAVNSEDPSRYCSEKCVTEDYNIHKLEMNALAEMRIMSESDSDDSCFLVMRISSIRRYELERRQVEQDVVHPVLGRSNTYARLMTLESKSTHMPETSKRTVRQIAHILSNIAKKSSLILASVDAEKLFYIIQGNAYQILDHRGRALGLGLFPLTSMMNHSCTPNCAHSFLFERHRPPRLVMVAIRDISAGEELYYSYVPLYQSTAARQDQLYGAYGFRCDCDRCSFSSLGKSAPSEGDDDDYPDDTFLDIHRTPTPSTTPVGQNRVTAILEALVLYDVDSVGPDMANRIQIALDATLLALRDPALGSLLHVENQGLLQVYGWLAKTASILLHRHHSLPPTAAVAEEARMLEGGPSLSLDQAVLYQKVTVAFAGLALGCIYFYARTVQLECADLERVVGEGLGYIAQNHELSDGNYSVDRSESFSERFSGLVLRFLGDLRFSLRDSPRLVAILRRAVSHAERWYQLESTTSIVECFVLSSKHIRRVCTASDHVH